ncbi:HNH endonuclease signature motif containing protein [Gordonia crocea]|uniref:HNH endonuclease signature motif containing protein n=1 Tax=Gordonia crocea TaxID=589162 RepID=UPI001379F83D|nr:HNH endonuclease signature motif containing protein [Gordonia crocea]
MESYAAWLRYLRAAELFDMVLAEMTDAAAVAGAGAEVELDLFDAHTQTAARLAMTMRVSQGWAENLLAQGMSLRDRLPQVALCLRDGLITAAQVRMIITRTELLDHKEVRIADAELAAAIRGKRGGYSLTGIRDLADRLVFRIDPDAVRRAREKSVANRTTWNNATSHGMANLGASMSAENAAIAHAAVHALAATVCANDGRSKAARASDAFYALLAGQRFNCECDRDDCPADIPRPGQLRTDTAGQIVVHVVTDAATAESTADNPGFMDGYGVLSAAHIRDILSRPNTLVKPLGSRSAPDRLSLPLHQPANTYRPSRALDTFVRIRDGRCTAPGCGRPAFIAEVDHVVEYNHADPAAGGTTHPTNLNSKCKFHHLLKTVGNWTDDQDTDADGHTHISWTTPEGVTIDGADENNEHLFNGLGRYRWHAPDAAAATAGPEVPPGRPVGDPEAKSRRVTSRLDRKHARRRAERNRNRKEREHHRNESKRLAANHKARVAGQGPPLLPDDPPY